MTPGASLTPGNALDTNARVSPADAAHAQHSDRRFGALARVRWAAGTVVGNG